MYSESLIFPTVLPGLFPRPRLVPNLLRDLKQRLPERESAGSRLARRLRRAAGRGRRIALGTADEPFEPLALDGAPLAALRSFDGLAVVVTTRAPEIVEHRELLAELDQRHAVLVDMRIAGLDPTSPDLRERLRAVTELAADGLTVRLIVAEPSGADERRPGDVEAGIRCFFAAAVASRAYDVVLDGLSPAWNRIFDRLRLEHGFPRALPGRG